METELEQLRQQLAAANARVRELNRSIDQFVQERDDAEECLSQLYYIATGNSPEWPNHFGHKEVQDAVTLLKENLKRAESTIAACKAAGFVTEHGEVRRVLGTLPITADGCVAGMGCELWADFNPPGINAPTQCTGPGWPCVPMTRLYGSREAAEAAKGGREG